MSEYPSAGRHAAAVPADSYNINPVALLIIKSKHNAHMVLVNKSTFIILKQKYLT